MRRVFSAVAALVLTAAGVSGADAIRISGSTAVNAAVFAEHKAEIEAAVGQPILVTPNGSGNGLKDLVEDRADVAMLSSVLA
jgi:ABC-type phosphate transport system substrate-binding protein